MIRGIYPPGGISMPTYTKKRNVILAFISIVAASTFLFQNCSKIAVNDIASKYSSSSLSCNGVGSEACAAEVARCQFNGQELADGQSVETFLASSVGYGKSCSSEQRICKDGALSGSFSFATCDVEVPAACLFNGQTIKHGDTVPAFTNSTVPFGSSCTPELRKCDNGNLSGEARFATCEVGAAMACLFNGQTVQHGASVIAFPTSSVAYDKTCVGETRVCSNGVLSGQGHFASCNPDAPKSCLFNGVTLASGQSVDAFAEAQSKTCQKESRVCTDGVLSGQFTNSSCVAPVDAPPKVENLCAQIRNIQGDMRVYVEPAKTTTESSILEFGTFADNYWSGDYGLGQLYERELSFELPTADSVSEMVLTKAAYDDWFLLSINGKTVYVGPKGGDRLLLSADGKVQYSETGFGVPELSTSWSFDLNIDIKPYLVAGTNKISTRTIVAGGGESAIRVLFKSKDCK